MGFDYERGIFTPDNHCLLPAQVITMVHEMQPGDIAYVDADAVACDLSKARRVWIAKHAFALSATDVVESYVEAYENGDVDDGLPDFARIFATNAGIVVDQSHTDQITWQSFYDRFNRRGGNIVDECPDDFLPVVHRIFNMAELEIAQTAFENENIGLEGTELAPILAKIEEVLDEKYGAVQPLELEGDDDEDDEPA